MSAPQRRGLHTPESVAALAVASLNPESLRLFALIVRLMASGDRDGAALVVEVLFAEKGREAPPDILEAIRPGWAEVERI